MLVTTCFTASKLNQAVEDCLQACHDSDHPFSALAAQIEALKAKGDWNEAELAKVEMATLSILQAMLGRG
jgi:hypothetical protein